MRLLIARRLLRDVEHEQQRVSLTQLIQNAKKSWHGVKLGKPDWGDTSLSVAFNAELRREKLVFHLILNGYREPLDFELPPTEAGNRWRRWIDTSLPSLQDIVEWQAAPPAPEGSYRAGPRSVVMLYAGIG